MTSIVLTVLLGFNQSNFNPNLSLQTLPSKYRNLCQKEYIIDDENDGMNVQYVILIIKITTTCDIMSFLFQFIRWIDTNTEVAVRPTISLQNRKEVRNSILPVKISFLQMDFLSIRQNEWFKRYRSGTMIPIRKQELFS